jgi:spermidine/putrescine transport system permease protein
MARVRRRGLGFYAVLYLAFVYAPLLLLPLFSINDSRFVTFPLSGLTLDWYREMARNPQLADALWTSLVIVVPVAFASTIIGMMAAIALTRYPLRFKAAILVLIMLPIAMPTLVLGVSLLTLIRGWFGAPLSLWTIGAGHLLLCLPYSVVVLMARLDGFDPHLEEASMDLGQSGFGTFRRITLPLMTPALVASVLLCSVVSFDEFLIAFFLSGPEATLPLYIWGSLRFPAKLPSTIALGTVLLVFSGALIILAEWVRRRGAPSVASGL